MRLTDVLSESSTLDQHWSEAQRKEAWEKAQELDEFAELSQVAKFKPSPLQQQRGTMVFGYKLYKLSKDVVVKRQKTGEFHATNKRSFAHHGSYKTAEEAQARADALNRSEVEFAGSYVIYSHGQIRHQQPGSGEYGGRGITKVSTPTLTSHDLLENYRRMMARVLQLITAKGGSVPKMPSYKADDKSKINVVEHGKFYIHNLGVRDLAGSPTTVSSYRIEKCDELVTLKGGPTKLNSDHPSVEIKRCPNLHNLDGIVAEAKGAEAIAYSIENCKGLRDISALPEHCGSVTISNCGIESLKGVGQTYLRVILKDGGLSLRDIKLKSHALGLFLIEGHMRWFSITGFKGAEIIEKHMRSHDRKAAMIDCQHELIDAGLEDLAQL